MRFEWTYTALTPAKAYTFLRQSGLSRAQIKRMKFHGGRLSINRHEQHTNYVLHAGDHVVVDMAPDVTSEQVVPFVGPVNVVYEDDWYLVVNKPAGIASIPDVAKSPDTMANRVKAYLIAQKAESTAIHVVTRLDRDTSGLILFAKHSVAHSLIDAQLHTDKLIKRYVALVSGRAALPQHGWIILRLGRTAEFYMHRGVTSNGKVSVTEYQVQAQTTEAYQVLVTLHTGRTHQIRAHFAALGHPLYGDDLYGGPLGDMQRQALHCAALDFWHPVLKRTIRLQAPLPADMQVLAQTLGLSHDN